MSIASFRVQFVVLGSLALCGCAKLLGIEDTELLPEPEPDVLACADTAVPSELGSFPIDVEAAVDDLATSCGQAGAADHTFAFTAPVTDYYVFDTFGTRFDTVLALYDQCDGAEISCNDNAGALPQSEIVRRLSAGQKALVVVEGKAGDRGVGTLQVSRVRCPEGDLVERTFPVDLTTASFGDDHAGSCGGAGQEDRAYHWVAPRDGVFAFRAHAESFSPVLSLTSGARCSDPLVGCNASSPEVKQAEVARRLRAGQEVSVIVDGKEGAGPFSFEVVERPGMCPQAVLPPGLGLPAQQPGARMLAPTCSPVHLRGPFGGLFEMRDKVYSFTVPKASDACYRTCDVTLRGTGSMVLYALDGTDCAGAELGCVPTQFDAGQGRHIATLSFEARDKAPNEVTIVAATTDSGTGTFEISSSCLEACP